MLPAGPSSPHVVHAVVVQPETVGAVGPIDQQLKVLPDAVDKRRTGGRVLTDGPGPAPHSAPAPSYHTHSLFRPPRSYYFAIFSNMTRVSSSVKGRIFPLSEHRILVPRSPEEEVSRQPLSPWQPQSPLPIGSPRQRRRIRNHRDGKCTSVASDGDDGGNPVLRYGFRHGHRGGSREVEDEGLLASLFRDRFPEAQWRERPDVGRYLRELSGSGLERLRREPERLAEERAQLLQQTRDLAFANYKTFIRGAECTERIHRLFGDVEASVGRLLDRLPSFQQSCRNFVKEAEEISSSRRMNTLTLNRHTEILEILEIPQLMDTCVRNSYYEEALELAAYVRRLEKKYSSIPVIQGIVNEVRQSMQLMLSQLIQQLRTNIQLPACLRVIGFLRRMDIFTEAELRVKFLQARDAWLRSILTAIPNDDPYFHITKTIEACRVHLFDIITQYRAIFSDEDPLLSPAVGEHTVNESAIFHGWVLQKVSQFLQVLETDLHRGIGGRLDSLLGQCMYFGLSFSRVGADFRGQLAPVFQQVAISTFQKAIQEAVEKFQDEMNSYTLILAPAILGSSNLPAAVPVTQPGTLQPPMVLLDFPPLACFLNNILVAFNDLRLCCPIALAQDVTRVLEDALAKVTKVILGFHRAEEAAFTNGERELFIQFCTVFLEDLVPYLNRCLQVLFPPAQIAQTLGIPPTQLSKYGNLGHVNISIVQEPLAFILPKKEMVFCLDEREPVPELTAPAPAPAPAPEPELPAEESSLEPITPAFPEEGQEQVESGEPLQADNQTQHPGPGGLLQRRPDSPRGEARARENERGNLLVTPLIP
ncbi:hypothetical protein QTO34_010736 [Cnephaeus nilssonii]|uniref:Conserved oligomeric Golgi complex subunit 8 n=1 Tax=Cnephaeus nilssonii TaxID=3371016 RepID=A0AA40HH23_CNENI|nr:hypothetical protein QTO34_010736 [Eptesicus nilssonii]